MRALFLSGSILGQLLRVTPVAALAGAVYLLVRRSHGGKAGHGVEMARFLLVCYLTGLVNLVLAPQNFWSRVWYAALNGHWDGDPLEYMFSGGVNLVPSLLRWMNGSLTLGSWVKTMLVGNFLMFVPFGVLLPLAFPGKQVLGISMLVPVCVEVLQPIVGRSFDVDDLILNCLGILAGFGVVRLLKR